MAAKLSLLEHFQPKRQFVLEQLPAIIGRSDEAEVTLPDRWVSRLHCEIREIEGRLVVRDLDSKHGTYVNGQRVAEAVLKLGDTLRVGMSLLRVQPAADRESDSAVSVWSGSRREG